MDGIIGLSFEHRKSDYCFVTFSCYLPPELSPWGGDASSFICHLLSQVYLCSEMDVIFICRDLNARIGGLNDFIPDIDRITHQTALDDQVNRHGETLLKVLKDSKMCVVCGRICPLDDNFTSVSSKGKALVDYIITPFDCLENCFVF